MTSDPIWLQEDYVYRVSRIGSTPLCIMYKLLEIAYMSYIYTQSNIHTRGSYFFFKNERHLLRDKNKITQQPLFFSNLEVLLSERGAKFNHAGNRLYSQFKRPKIVSAHHSLPRNFFLQRLIFCVLFLPAQRIHLASSSTPNFCPCEIYVSFPTLWPLRRPLNRLDGPPQPVVGKGRLHHWPRHNTTRGCWSPKLCFQTTIWPYQRL